MRISKITFSISCLSLFIFLSCSNAQTSIVGCWGLFDDTDNLIEIIELKKDNSYNMYYRDENGNPVTFSYNNYNFKNAYLELESENGIILQGLTEIVNDKEFNMRYLKVSQEEGYYYFTGLNKVAIENFLEHKIIKPAVEVVLYSWVQNDYGWDGTIEITNTANKDISELQFELLPKNKYNEPQLSQTYVINHDTWDYRTKAPWLLDVIKAKEKIYFFTNTLGGQDSRGIISVAIDNPTGKVIDVLDTNKLNEAQKKILPTIKILRIAYVDGTYEDYSKKE